MKLRFAVLALVLGVTASGAAEPPRPYRSEARVAYIRGALAAIAETPPATLREGIEYARTLARTSCSAGAERLRVECLLVATERYCHDRGAAEAQRCALSMDVLVANVLADERLIPPERRYQIVRETTDYRSALARELRRIQAALAVDYRLRAGDVGADSEALAASIDRYCLSAPDETKLAYPMCVSSLVWFIKGPS